MLSLGFSPCPNDTYIFNHLVNRSVDSGQLFAPPQLEDVETLNRWAIDQRLDVTKLSYHAAGFLLDHYCILQTGSALGRGCGPLVIGKEDCALESLRDKRVGIPGQYTTAALLFKMVAPPSCELIEMRFDLIPGAVESGNVAAGVIIHESRFTYQDMGLICLRDLGQWWEEKTGLPIPLGCIAARRSLGYEKIRTVEQLIRKSLEQANHDPQSCQPYIKQYAQETAESVVTSHIGLYVNDFSLDLGKEGRAAVQTFIKKGQHLGHLPESDRPLFCLD
ncbi:MAG: 1,4-dihydroxy-6-naphthoate synthase [Desulfobulbaceae bacterium]|nr:MAG: 1,4-dihydroxy-6-naphthoate synthase [Desulfobulbaceae bacterium]